MKKTGKWLLAVTMLAGITGCTPTEEPEESPEPTETTEPAETTPAETAETTDEKVGAWEIYSYVDIRNMTDDDLKHFEDATAELTGVGYEPVGVLVTQVVSGMNTAFLAKGTQLSTDTEPGLYVVTVYTDTEQVSSVLAINRIIPDAIRVAPVSEQLLGGWEVHGTGRPGSIGEDGEIALNEALEGLTGMNYMPATLLATQLVSGMNYRFLCFGTTVSDTPETGLYVMDVYAPLEGKAQITNVTSFDLLYYVTPQN